MNYNSGEQYNSRKLSDTGIDHPGGVRVLSYYNHYKAFGFKESYSYAAHFWLIVCTILLGLFLFFTFKTADQTAALPEMPKDVDTASQTFFIGFPVITLGFVIIKSIYEIGRLRHLKDYDRSLLNSSCSEVPLESLAADVGVTEKRAEKDLRWLFKKGLMQNCSLIQDESPRVVLSDLLLNCPAEESIKCPNCGSKLQIRPGDDLKCSSCGSNLTSAQWFSDQYLDQGRLERIKSISSVLYFIGVIIGTYFVVFVGQSLYEMIWLGTSSIYPGRILTTLAVMAGITITLLRTSHLLRLALELAARCDNFFMQSVSSAIPCEKIASMMRWSVPKTNRTLKRCRFLKLMRQCSYDGAVVTVERTEPAVFVFEADPDTPMR